MTMLSHIINPVSTDTFFQKYWEQTPLHIPRESPDYYADILRPADIDGYLNQRLAPTDIKVHRSSERIPMDQWTRFTRIADSREEKVRTVDSNLLLGLFEDGATLILNGAHRSIPTLISFCKALEYELAFPTQTNLYLTPPNAQGFGRHYDTHDVFIVQIHGSKLWRIYSSPIQLPTPDQGKTFGKEDLAALELEQECVLHAGDLLYLPRGFVHDAETQHEPSIHITLGLYPFCGFHLIDDIATLAHEVPEFRKSLPHGFTNAEDRARFKTEFREQLIEFINEMDIDVLLGRQSDAFVNDRTPNYQRRFNDLLKVAELNLNSVVSKRKHILYKVERDGKDFSVKFEKRPCPSLSSGSTRFNGF